MKERSVSRRDFLRGAGTVGVAAGAMAALGGAGVAVAAEEAAEAGENAYGLACDTTWVPVRKAACPGPRGPVGFEDREIAADELAATEDCDLVVVGAGIAGLMAALKGAEEGASVICVEKMTRGRGCFECFGAVNAKCQEGTEINKVHLIDEMHRAAYWRVRPEPIRTYVDRSGEATDFWQAMLDKGANGFVITKVEQAPSSNGMPAVTPLIDTELGFYDSPCLPPDAGVRSGYSGIYVCLEMQEVAKQYDNLELRFSTPAVQLIREGDRVAGVIVKNPDGSYGRINAGKGVILATGGYDANPELMEACDPSRGLRYLQLVESRLGHDRRRSPHGHQGGRPDGSVPAAGHELPLGQPRLVLRRPHVERHLLRPHDQSRGQALRARGSAVPGRVQRAECPARLRRRLLPGVRREHDGGHERRCHHPGVQG